MEGLPSLQYSLPINHFRRLPVPNQKGGPGRLRDLSSDYRIDFPLQSQDQEFPEAERRALIRSDLADLASGDLADRNGQGPVRPKSNPD
jgi:hypothetical protein